METLLCLGLLVLTVTTSQLPPVPWIKPLPDGLDLRITNDAVVVVCGEWTVMITITEPKPPPELLDFVFHLRSQLQNQTIFNAAPSTGWLDRLHLIEQECITPHQWWASAKTRGLINVVGGALHYLFGTATDDDIKDVKKMLNQLQRNQGRLVNQVYQFTTILNHTYDEIQATHTQLNRITENLRHFTHRLNVYLKNVVSQIRNLNLKVDMEFMISQLEAISHRYVRSHEAFIHRKENLETGLLTEHLLPPSVLTTILTTSKGLPGQLIEPLQWYYEHSSIIPIWTEEYLVYKTRLPVVDPVQWQYIHLHQYPMPMKSFQARLMLPSEVLRDTSSGTLDVSPHCYGERPRVCRRGLVMQANVHPCLTGLLMTVPTYNPECIVVLERRLPIDTVDAIEYNRYILITSGAELILRCSGHVEQLIVITSGVYEISLNYPCTLFGNEWKMVYVFQRTINVTLVTKEIKFDINQSVADLFENHYEVDRLVFDLHEMDAVDRKQVVVRDLLQPLGFQKKQSIVKYLWHLFWILVFVVLGTGGVWGRAHLMRQGMSGILLSLYLFLLQTRNLPVQLTVVPKSKECVC